MIQPPGKSLGVRCTVAGVIGLVLVSCGGSDSAPDGPPVLRVFGDLADSREAQTDSVGGAQLTMLANMRFELAGELPPLDGPSPSYVFTSSVPPQAKVDQLLAVFDIEGPLEAQSAQAGGGYVAGSTDGLEPALYVSGDAVQYWNYSPPWTQSPVNPACLDTSGIEPVAPPTPVSDSVVVADTEAPSADSLPSGESATAGTDPVVEDPCPENDVPQDVPSEDQARELFVELMSRIGVDAAELDIEVFSDSYGASVTGFSRIGGIRSPLSWSVSFGEGGRIMWAGGVLAEPTFMAEYERIGTSKGLDRLNDQQSALVADGAGDLDPEDLSAASSGGSGEIVVRIDAVEEELVTLNGVDGSVYLVPGYAFLAEPDEMGFEPRYTVSALSDEYVETVAPDQVEPGSTSAGEADSEPNLDTEPGAMMEEISTEEANTLLGMSETEATEFAEDKGWVVRIAARDGEQFALTMDYNPKRVNLSVENDLVTDVFIG